ncbi:kelch-like protein 15 [Corticium candelabrum]|uniref:kelch-like protein 15 n=1 Tax=Corticium candelabrum TaxID=121492 RepID=UPI002E255274|nr:kelch-like protein 15 [Corticium candelabrum]
MSEESTQEQPNCSAKANNVNDNCNENVCDDLRLSAKRKKSDDCEFNKFQKIPYPSTVMKSWESFYRNQEMVDITLLIGSNKTEFKAHKVVLCAHSDVLKTMLSSPMKEARENTIEFPEADETAFGALLEFFYTGNVPVDKSFICQLIKLCDYLHVPNLKQHCCTWLPDNMVPEDACEYLLFSSQPSADEQLYKNCFQWIKDHATLVVCTDGFAKHMTAKEVEELAASDDLNLDEIQLFEGIKRWIEYDVSRHEDGIDIAKYLRLPMMNTRDLLGCVQSSGFVQSDAILRALKYLQQPLGHFPYDIDHLYVNLRVPSARVPRITLSFTRKSQQLTSSQRPSIIPTHSNHAFVRSSETLRTSKPLRIPSCVRVQLTTKSTVNRKVIVGLLILLSDQQYRCGVRLHGATLSTFPLYNTVLIPTGCIVALKFHITSDQVCIHLNGAVIAQIALTTRCCCSYLPLFARSRKPSQPSGSHYILDKTDGKKDVFVEVAMEEIEDTASVSVKGDVATCCPK